VRWPNLNVVVIDHLDLSNLRVLAVCPLFVQTKVVNIDILHELLAHLLLVVGLKLLFGNIAVGRLVVQNEKVHVTLCYNLIGIFGYLLSLESQIGTH